MVFGTIAGAFTGFWIGVWVWRRWAANIVQGQPRHFDYYDKTSDKSRSVRAPPRRKTLTGIKGKNGQTRQEARRTPQWLLWPDYERLIWLNTATSILWPRICAATEKTVRAVIEDGKAEWCKAAKAAGVPLHDLVVNCLDLGPMPPTLSGMKIYDTPQDEVILDVPLQWGSQCCVRMTARLQSPRLRGVALDIPVQIDNIWLRGLCRITLRPLVDVVPIVGAVTVSLMDSPDIDMQLSVADCKDLFALPLTKLILDTIMDAALGDMLVYPNSMSFDVMDNGGHPAPMHGMLICRVIRGEGLPSTWMDKIDSFVEVEVRQGRPLKTRVIDNNENPEWDEVLKFVVDDQSTQVLTLVLKDEDLLRDKVVGYQCLPLSECIAVNNPGKPFWYELGLKKVPRKLADLSQFNVEVSRPEDMTSPYIKEPNGPEVRSSPAGVPQPVADLLMDTADGGGETHAKYQQQQQQDTADGGGKTKETYQLQCLQQQQRQQQNGPGSGGNGSSGKDAASCAKENCSSSLNGGNAPVPSAGSGSVDSGISVLERTGSSASTESIATRQRRRDLVKGALKLDKLHLLNGWGGHVRDADGAALDRPTIIRVPGDPGVGKLHIELQYFPFKRKVDGEEEQEEEEGQQLLPPEAQTPSAAAAEAEAEEGDATGSQRLSPPSKPRSPSRAPAAAAALKAGDAGSVLRVERGVSRVAVTEVQASDRGVLTCTIIRCLNLQEGNDVFVQLTLEDNHSGKEREGGVAAKRVEWVKSNVKINESSPRWDMKFDFVDISAMSSVTATVMKCDSGVVLSIPVPIVGSLVDKAVRAVMSITQLLKSAAKRSGWVRISVADVARNGYLADVWTLRDVDKGNIELKFEWHAVNLEHVEQQ